MQSTTPEIHDARQGFHDIKPLPQFYPFPWSWLFAAILLLGLIYLFLRKKPQSSAPPLPRIPKLSPIEQARREMAQLISQLERHEVSLRQCSTTASLILRRYLAQHFQTQAVEQTNRELLASLRRSLPDLLRGLALGQVEDFLRRFAKLLRFFEQMTFACQSEQKFSANPEVLLARMRETLALVEELEGERLKLTPIQAQSTVLERPQHEI